MSSETDFNKLAINYSTAVAIGNAKSKAKVVAKATLADAFLKGTPDNIASILIAIASMEDKVADKADVYIEALEIGKYNYALFLAVVQVITQEGEKLNECDKSEMYGIISMRVEEFDSILEIAEGVEFVPRIKSEKAPTEKPSPKDLYNKWITVGDKSIDKILYNDSTHRLQVNYTSGKTIMYDDVQEGVFAQLMASGSKALYIEIFIKPNFRGREF